MLCCARKKKAANTDKDNTNTASNSTNNSMDMLRLEDQEYYHGLISKDDVRILLEDQGDFLLRRTESENDDQEQTVISIRWDGEIKQYIIRVNQGKYYLQNSKTFNSIPSLVHFYLTSGEAIRDDTCLKRAVNRTFWQLEPSQIELGEKVGSGAFGEVYKGTLKKDGQEIEVAVKLNKDMNFQQRRELLMEARFMTLFNHPNLTRILGITDTDSEKNEPVMLVIELAKGGDLKNYLKKHKEEITPKQRLKFCLDAAKGMEYLAGKNCIHRDLAVRNCLLDENLNVKLSDFGMSKCSDYYKIQSATKAIPIRWLAPETMKRKVFTTPTDVWTFAILMYEIYTNAGTPYPEIATNGEVQKRVGFLSYTMEPPASAPAVVAELMKECWKQIPDQRPTFEYIRNALQDAYEKCP